MKCLCCGKEITSKTNELDQWHKACIRKFFYTDSCPVLDLSNEALDLLANDSIRQGITLPGVQKKLSLHLNRDGNRSPRLTLVNHPFGYILKPQSKDIPFLPEAEYLVMSMARDTGLTVVPFALLRYGEQGELAFITRRIDKDLSNTGNSENKIYAMEDFCQLSHHMTSDKYRGSYERCAKIISTWSTQSGLDLSELFLRLLFCFVSGNSDMHLKNFSLIETQPANGTYTLSPAYDLLPVNILYPEDTEETALTLHEKKRNIRRSDFLHYAETIGIERTAAEKMIRKIISMKPRYLESIHSSYLSEELKSSLIKMLDTRITALSATNES